MIAKPVGVFPTTPRHANTMPRRILAAGKGKTIMADAPIVEEADGSYHTREHCSTCQKVTHWLKEADAPWHCIRCRHEAPRMGGMIYCQYCHKETLFRIYNGTIIFCTECAAHLNARLATTIPEPQKEDIRPATLEDTSVGCGRQV